MNAPWLKEGVTTVTLGHATLADGAGRTSLCVHGQSAFSGGGDGKSTSLLRSIIEIVIVEIVRIIGRWGNRAKDRRTACGRASGYYLTIESLGQTLGPAEDMAHVEQRSAVLRVLQISTEVARKGVARSRAVYCAGLG